MKQKKNNTRTVAGEDERKRGSNLRNHVPLLVFNRVAEANLRLHVMLPIVFCLEVVVESGGEEVYGFEMSIRLFSRKRLAIRFVAMSAIINAFTCRNSICNTT